MAGTAETAETAGTKTLTPTRTRSRTWSWRTPSLPPGRRPRQRSIPRRTCRSRGRTWTSPAASSLASRGPRTRARPRPPDGGPASSWTSSRSTPASATCSAPTPLSCRALTATRSPSTCGGTSSRPVRPEDGRLPLLPGGGVRRGSGAGDSEGRVDRFVHGQGGDGDGDAPGRAGLTEGERAPPPPVRSRSELVPLRRGARCGVRFDDGPVVVCRAAGCVLFSTWRSRCVVSYRAERADRVSTRKARVAGMRSVRHLNIFT